MAGLAPPLISAAIDRPGAGRDNEGRPGAHGNAALVSGDETLQVHKQSEGKTVSASEHPSTCKGYVLCVSFWYAVFTDHGGKPYIGCFVCNLVATSVEERVWSGRHAEPEPVGSNRPSSTLHGLVHTHICTPIPVAFAVGGVATMCVDR